MQQTLVLVKPDALQRGLIGEIIGRFERKGLKLIGLKMLRAGDELLSEHYAHHVDKPFFVNLRRFMQSSPLVAMVWEGVEAIEAVRLLAGVTDARAADAGTIRGDLGMSKQNNLIHASDSPQNAAAEVARFFSPDELHDYDKSEYLHIYAEDER